jgi:glycosyltransferase involved in cell wall biosynthesis
MTDRPAARAPITAVICTRDRGAAVLTAARSVLANTHPAFRLIVVDQSSGDRSRQALEGLRGDPRLTYLRSETRGLSRARNLALRAAETEVVAFTDDDCEVSEDWLATLQDLFTEHPKLAVAFCTVKAGPMDETAGFTPAFHCTGTRIIGDFWAKRTALGMGAGLALRRTVACELGGFDEMLGAGGPFASGEDIDIANRAVLAGFEVCETDRTFVIHHGFRTWAEGKVLSRQTWYGIGALSAKPFRVRRYDFLPVPVHQVLVHAVWPVVRDALQLRLPRGPARLLYFARGFAHGLKNALDPRTLMFVVPPEGSGQKSA